MGAKGQIPFKRVKNMLERCAPGYSIRKTEHRQQILFRAKIHRFRLGPHGAKRSYRVSISKFKYELDFPDFTSSLAGCGRMLSQYH